MYRDAEARRQEEALRATKNEAWAVKLQAREAAVKMKDWFLGLACGRVFDCSVS